MTEKSPAQRHVYGIGTLDAGSELCGSLVAALFALPEVFEHVRLCAQVARRLELIFPGVGEVVRLFPVYTQLVRERATSAIRNPEVHPY